MTDPSSGKYVRVSLDDGVCYRELSPRSEGGVRCYRQDRAHHADVRYRIDRTGGDGIAHSGRFLTSDRGANCTTREPP